MRSYEDFPLNFRGDTLPNSVSMVIEIGCKFNDKNYCNHRHRFYWTQCV